MKTSAAITYHCPIDSMGDCVTESDAAGYRCWVKSRIEAAFPGRDVTVTDRKSARSVEADELDDDEMSRLHECVKRAWDVCPWNWVAAVRS